MAGFFEEDAKPVVEAPAPAEPSFFEDDAKPADAPEADDATLKEIGSFVAGLFGGPAKEVLRTISAPMVEVDKVTGAPPRAAVGALQDGKGMGEAAQAFLDQLKAGAPGLSGAGELLPGTPTGEDIARKGMVQRDGILPPFADTMAPAIGAGVEGALDLTQLIPSGAMRTGAGKVAEGLDVANRGMLKGVQAAERTAAKGAFRVGQVMTQGAINPEKAVKASARLNFWEHWFPGTKDFGAMARAGKEVGEARAALQQNRVIVPGSHDVALQVSDYIHKNAGRTLSHPHAQAVIEHISGKAFEMQTKMIPQIVPPQVIEGKIAQLEGEIASAEQQFRQVDLLADPTYHRETMAMADQIKTAKSQLEAIKAKHLSGEPFTVNIPQRVQVPRDLTLDELDDITGMMDEMVYTGLGNEKSLRRIWGPTIKKSRAVMDKAMQSVPEGMLFKEKKAEFEALATAGKHRSKLLEASSIIGAGGATVMSGPAGLLLLSLRPRTYYQVMGTLKIPGDVLRTLTLARETGKGAAVRDAIMAIAAKNPTLAERIVRSTVLVSGKPEAQQFLSEDEANTLGLHREFDPSEVAMERQRIQSDKSLSSSEKAQKLTAINRNGYIIVDKPAPMPEQEPETTNEKVFGGEEGLQRLMESLQSRSH